MNPFAWGNISKDEVTEEALRCVDPSWSNFLGTRANQLDTGVVPILSATRKITIGMKEENRNGAQRTDTDTIAHNTGLHFYGLPVSRTGFISRRC